jgi:hypothetical protein
MDALIEGLALVLFLTGLFGLLGLVSAGCERLADFGSSRQRRGKRLPALRVPAPTRSRPRRRRRSLPAHAARVTG